jgi:hypothetical protein
MATEPVDLDRLDALHKAATPGPWEVCDYGDFWAVNEVTTISLANRVFDDGSGGGEYGPECSEDTRDFIIALRNAYPAMAEELRRLRKLVREYAEARDNCRVVQSRSGEVSPLTAAGDALYAAGKEIAK